MKTFALHVLVVGILAATLPAFGQGSYRNEVFAGYGRHRQTVGISLGVSESNIQSNLFMNLDDDGRIYVPASAVSRYGFQVTGTVGSNLPALDRGGSVRLSNVGVIVYDVGPKHEDLSLHVLGTNAQNAVGRSGRVYMEDIPIRLSYGIELPLGELLKGIPDSLLQQAVAGAFRPEGAEGAGAVDPAARGITVKGMTMVPLRTVAQWLGAEVVISGRDITVSYGSATRLRLTLNEKVALVNGTEVVMLVPALERNGTTYVPLRFIGDSFGVGVVWEAANRRAIIAHPRECDTLTLPVAR